MWVCENTHAVWLRERGCGSGVVAGLGLGVALGFTVWLHLIVVVGEVHSFDLNAWLCMLRETSST